MSKKRTKKSSRRKLNWRQKLLLTGQVSFLAFFLLSCLFLVLSFFGSSRDMTVKSESFLKGPKTSQQLKKRSTGSKKNYEEKGNKKSRKYGKREKRKKKNN